MTVYYFITLQCNRELTEQLLTEHLTSSFPQPIAVIGCGCSNATEGVANISLLQNIPVVSNSIERKMIMINNYYTGILLISISNTQ